MENHSLQTSLIPSQLDNTDSSQDDMSPQVPHVITPTSQNISVGPRYNCDDTVLCPLAAWEASVALTRLQHILAPPRDSFQSDYADSDSDADSDADADADSDADANPDADPIFTAYFAQNPDHNFTQSILNRRARLNNPQTNPPIIDKLQSTLPPPPHLRNTPSAVNNIPQRESIEFNLVIPSFIPNNPSIHGHDDLSLSDWSVTDCLVDPTPPRRRFAVQPGDNHHHLSLADTVFTPQRLPRSDVMNDDSDQDESDSDSPNSRYPTRRG